LLTFFRICKQDKIIDLSYHRASPIAKHFEKPLRTADFRQFNLPRREKLGLYINLPWYFKYSVNTKIKDLLEDAKDRCILLDILIVHTARNKKQKWFLELQQLCTWHCFLRDKFEVPTGRETDCGLVIFGYITTRSKKKAASITKQWCRKHYKIQTQ